MSGNQVGQRTAEKAKIICPPPVGGHKNQLSSPVAMDNNGHLQPSTRLPACL